MKKIKYAVIAIVAIAAVALVSGCLGQKSPSEYFPAATGAEWSYRINFGSTDPRIHGTIIYNPIIGGFVSNELAERPFDEILISETYKKEPNCCHLKFKIGRMGSRKMNNQDILIAELLVVQDDLDLFGGRNPLNHSWAMTKGPEGFQAIKTAIIPAREFGLITPNMIVTSVQLVFFVPSGNENEQAIVGGDWLKSLGYDNNVPECKDSPCMHFQRSVSSVKLTEDTWYASRKGLVRLEQKVGGEPSMTWALESFKTS